MKSLFVFAALVSSTAFAKPVPQAVLQQIYARAHMHQAKVLDENQPPNPNPPEELKPVRQATIKFAILKTTYSKGQDGSFQATAEVVCEQNLMADVFDARGKDNYSIAGGSMISCPSTLNDQKVNVYVGGLLVLNHYPWMDGDARDYKDHSIWLSVDRGADHPGNPNGQDFLYGFVGTAEMGPTNMIGYITPQESDVKEFFTATYKVIDTP